MAPIDSSKKSPPFIPPSTDVRSKLPPNVQPPDKRLDGIPFPSTMIQLMNKRRELTQVKQQWVDSTNKLYEVGKQYGVQSPEYAAQKQVTDQLYARMQTLQEEIARLEKEVPVLQQRPNFPPDIFDSKLPTPPTSFPVLT